MLPEDTPYNRRQASELMEFAELTPGDHVLEVGCGMGRHTFLLADRGLKMEGLDLSPELIGRLHDFDGGRYDIRTHTGDILDFSTTLHGKFDAVIGFFTLHHLYGSLDAYFSAMAGMLRSGGRLAFVEPNPYNPLYYLQILFTPGMHWRAEKGILGMRPTILLGSMQRAGLTRLGLKRFGFFPRVISNSLTGQRLERSLEKVGVWRAFLPFQMIKGYLA